MAAQRTCPAITHTHTESYDKKASHMIDALRSQEASHDHETVLSVALAEDAITKIFP